MNVVFFGGVWRALLGFFGGGAVRFCVLLVESDVEIFVGNIIVILV